MKYNNLAKNLKVYRKRMGLTQKSLGEKILKSEISIRKYEGGNVNIPPSTLSDICNVLGISSDILLGDDKDKYFLENFKQTHEKIIHSSQKALSVAEKYKSWGESFKNELDQVVNNPKYLLKVILEYLENTEEYYSPLFVNMLDTNDDKLPYFTDKQISNIIERVTDLVKYDIYKIENNLK